MTATAWSASRVYIDWMRSGFVLPGQSVEVITDGASFAYWTHHGFRPDRRQPGRALASSAPIRRNVCAGDAQRRPHRRVGAFARCRASRPDLDPLRQLSPAPRWWPRSAASRGVLTAPFAVACLLPGRRSYWTSPPPWFTEGKVQVPPTAASRCPRVPDQPRTASCQQRRGCSTATTPTDLRRPSLLN